MKMLTGRLHKLSFKLGITAFLIVTAFSNYVQAQPATLNRIDTVSASDSLSAAERNEIFAEVWRLINEKYYDANFHGVDWNASRKRFAPQIEKSADDKDFYALLDRMVGELRDSHTRVYSPVQRERQRAQRRTSVGITVRKIEGKSVVTNVEPDSEAALAGVKPGMIVRKIDGREIKQILTKARAEIGASSSERATEMRVYSKILGGDPETILNLELTGANGKSLNVNLKRKMLTSKPFVAARLLSSGIAYLKFSGFDESLETEIGAALEKLKNAPAMILDLRDNRGGDGEMGLRFAANFFDREITVASRVTRNGKPPVPGMPMILQTGGAAKDTQIYLRPLAVLINEGTASTSELIAGALQEQNRATVLGTNSCGCVLGFLDYIKLTGGGFLTMSEFGFITPKQRTLEGFGITPDKLIPPTVKAVVGGRDIGLERAEQFLRKFTQSPR